MNLTGSPSPYPLDNGAPQAGARFASLSTIYDDVTFRHLERLGIRDGWRCLEVGAGAGFVATFMSDRVGVGGTVVATDINTDWLPDDVPATIDVRRHDIGVDPLPEAAFDLVHARAVLTFVPQRRWALTRMMSALKPGGWILIEELVPPVLEGWGRYDDPDAQLAHKARSAIIDMIRLSGGDLDFIRDVPTILADSGLTDIGAEGFFLPFRTEAVANLSRANIDQLERSIVAAGLMSSAELDRYRTLLDSPNLGYPASMALISVWGQRRLA